MSETDASNSPRGTAATITTITSSDPYFVHPSDNPTAVLVQPLLHGDNYCSWLRSMTKALSAKAKLGFINGTLVVPASSDEKHVHWRRADDLVSSWICHSTIPSIKASIDYLPSSLMVWKDLKERFAQTSAPKLYQLKQSISTLKQGSNTLSANYTSIRSLWDEIDSIRPLPTCICGASYLGELSLAGGALAIGLANITGYSILSGLAMGMEPICGQAYGAKKLHLLGLCLQKAILMLLSISFPIGFLWLNMKKILIFFGQDEDISSEAQLYILCTLPDLFLQSILHPLRIYLRSQSITLPLSYCATFAIILHVPINYFLVSYLGLGIRGVALSGIWTNFNLVGSLIIYIIISGVYQKTWNGLSSECLKDWKSLLNLAIPSCISVCLEWWWYEIMILLCGLLMNPRATVASMGILIQTTSLIYIFPSSLSFAVSTRVGNELGANQPKKARLAALMGLCCSFSLGFSALIFATMVRNVWASMFSTDLEIIKLTAMVLPIIGLCELGNCPQTTLCGVLRGTARPKIGANINLGSFYLVGMPVAVGLSFYCGYDFKGLWFGLLAAQSSCVLLLLIVLGRTDWELQAIRAKELTQNSSVLVLDDDTNDTLKETREEEKKMIADDLSTPLITNNHVGLSLA